MSTLQAMVIGATYGKGVSTKSGAPRPYEFANILYLKRGETYSPNAESTITNYGQTEGTISAKPDLHLMEKIQKATEKSPVWMTLHLEADPQNPSRNLVANAEVKA